jgi:hypothetical protein
MSARMMSAAVFAVALAASARPVFAEDVSRAVISAFRGQFVVTKDDLPEGKNDKDTISKIKAARLKTVEGTAKGDVTGWNFHYTAFLTKGGATHLKLEFLNGDKLSADQGLDGVDPKSMVLTGDISIDEDEGLSKGKTYTVQVMNGSSIVAKTTLTMK